jgi:hypothetical protein
MALEAAFDDDDERAQALTRDGDSTTLLPVLCDGETMRALDGGEGWRLDATSAGAWEEARQLVEQMVSVPAYPWEWIERGARPRCEVAEWQEWEERARSFLRAVGLGEPVLVPMRASGDGAWRGSVVSNRGEMRRLAYSTEKGLWFRLEGEA